MPHRFFLDPDTFTDERATLRGPVAHQIARVLRLRVGDPLVLLDGDGGVYTAAVAAVRAGREAEVDVTLGPREIAAGDPAANIHLYQALLKGDHFTYALQKAVEVGVGAVYPLITERGVVTPDAHDQLDTSPKMGRWRDVVREAAEQSRRGRIPTLTPPRLFPAALAQDVSAQEHLRLIAWEGGVNGEVGPSVQPLRTALATFIDHIGIDAARIAAYDIVVGPEGGFTADEVAQTVAAGFAAVSLGPRILRAETAGPVAAALILYTLGQMD